MTAAMPEAAAKIAHWREHPAAFVREVIGVTPDPWQDKVLEAFPTQQRIAMKACKGPGKSAILSWLFWNFLLTRPHPKCVCTSISEDNLKDGLWSEMSLWQKRSPILTSSFTWTAERISYNRDPQNWFLSARNWPKSGNAQQQADTLAGLHAEYTMIAADEAGGIPSGVVAAAEGSLSTGKENKLLIAGNPTHLSGPLYDACTKDRALWYLVEITGDPDDPMRSPRIKIEWARELIAKWGRNNPIVLVNVFGQFPPGQSNALLGVEEVAAASRRGLAERDYINAPKIMGVDVARFGDDASDIIMRQGNASWKPASFRNLDEMELAGEIALRIQKHQPDATFIDTTGGYGGGTYARLLQLGYKVLPVVFSQRAIDEATYANLRAEMWMKMSLWLRAGGCIADDPELIADLVAPTYKFTANNRLILEEKAEIKKRLGRSPDKGDALACTFAAPVASRGLTTTVVEDRLRNAANNRAKNYDPYSDRI